MQLPFCIVPGFFGGRGSGRNDLDVTPWMSCNWSQTIMLNASPLLVAGSEIQASAIRVGHPRAPGNGLRISFGVTAEIQFRLMTYKGKFAGVFPLKKIMLGNEAQNC